jgi:hypothetical protein
MASKWPETKEEIEQIFNEALSQNDRTAAIILGSVVELNLQEAIQGRWPPISNTLRETIFDGYGPLADFSSKIDVGFAMGIFGPQTRTDLHSIRWIRNRFAHSMGSITFETDKIAERTKQIKTATPATEEQREGVSEPRWIFCQSSLLICMSLLLTLPKVLEHKYAIPGFSPILP